MKLKLDTDKKTIQVEASVNLWELLKAVKKILPNGEWKEFQLEPKVIDNTNWTNPIIITERIPQYYPWYVTTSGTPLPDNYTFADYGDNNVTLCSANNNQENIYNLEV